MQNNVLTREEIDNLTVSYLSGQIDEEALLALKEWCSESSENLAYVRQQFELWISSASEVADFDKDAAFERFRQRVAAATEATDSEPHKPLHLYIYTLYKVAAVAILLLLPLAGYWYGNSDIQSQFADITVEAPMGARTKMYLPDGTLAWLNAGTKMTYSQGYGVNNREVTLQGEGYFEVTPNKQLPFTINSEKLSLEVLGTKFNFRNYEDDAEATVNLIEGKVALQSSLCGDERFVLHPRQAFSLNKLNGKVSLTKHDGDDEVRGWTNNELFFNEESLASICRKLSRSYNVEIMVADSLKPRLFYGSFTRDTQSIDDILNIMSSTGKMKYRKHNGNYTIY